MDAKSHPKKSRRKKLHEGEVVGVVNAMLDFLNNQYKPINLDDVINWDSVEDFGYSRDVSFYGDHIESVCSASRKNVFRLFLDIIDCHCRAENMPPVFISQVLFGRLALAAFLRHNKNVIMEAPPWNDFPRNEIAAAVIDNVIHLWFDQPNGSSYRGFWEHGESLRIMDDKKYQNVIAFAEAVWTARLI